MKNKEFKEMLAMLRRLMRLIDDYDYRPKETKEENPIQIPPKVYDEICKKIKQSHITLFGVS